MPDTARLTRAGLPLEDADARRPRARRRSASIRSSDIRRRRSRACARCGERLAGAGVALRLRTPTIVRPEERRAIEKWLDLGAADAQRTPRSRAGVGRRRDATSSPTTRSNVFNAHTAVEVFRLGARRIVASVELTTRSSRSSSRRGTGEGFDVFLYGRPEGMTIEHCVLSAAFDREPTTCRDLCVAEAPERRAHRSRPGYTFPVATDSACRNRLLHSRPVDGVGVPAASSGARAFAAISSCSTCPGDDVARDRRALSRDARRAERGDASRTSTQIRRAVGRDVHARAFRARGLAMPPAAFR